MPSELFGFIYYEIDDKAFERAARFSATKLDPSSIVELVGVRTEQDFVDAWGGILRQATHNRTKVARVELYTHASKQKDLQDGLEFANKGGGGTLTKQEIENLPKMPWGSNATIYLFGCNTGLKKERGWCPAETFAKTQGVRASGQTGWTYFSTKSDVYHEITPNDKEIYLQAYLRMRNHPLYLGDGSVMPPKLFSP